MFVTDKFLIPFYSNYLHQYDTRIQYLKTLFVGFVEMQVIEMEMLYGRVGRP